MNTITNLSEQSALQSYLKILSDMLLIQFPELSLQDLNAALDYSINKRYKKEDASIYNNYNNKTVNLDLVELTNYIIDREPIITAWGVLWKRKGSCPNPLISMIKGFMDNRNIHKKEMFKYPKGTREYAHFNLIQLLDKLDANGTLM